jgi:hypothetical protein
VLQPVVLLSVALVLRKFNLRSHLPSTAGHEVLVAIVIKLIAITKLSMGRIAERKSCPPGRLMFKTLRA